MAEQGARQMLPEVQRYVESVETANAAQSAAVAAADTKYPERYGYGEEGRRQANSYSEVVNKAYTTRADVQEAAWSSLKTSSDPLVKWIAENCTDYRQEAQCILVALPATVDELDDLADKNDWCGVWGKFRQLAIDRRSRARHRSPESVQEGGVRADRRGRLLPYGDGGQATHRQSPGCPDPGSLVGCTPRHGRGIRGRPGMTETGHEPPKPE